MKKQKPTRTPKTYKKRWISTLVEYELYGDEYVKTHEEGYWYAGPMALATTDPNWVVTYWRFGNDGTESGHTWVAAENANPAKGDIDYDTTYFFRIDVEEDSGNNSKNTTAQLYYNLNGAGATIVNATSSVVRATATSNIADAADTTNRLSGTYTFDTTNEGFDEVDGQAGGGTADLNSTGMEFLFSFQVRSADVSEDDTIVLSIVLGAVNNDDSPTYPTWPTITGAAAANTPYSLLCDTGSYAYTGSTAGVSAGYKLPLATGSYAYTGSVQTATQTITVTGNIGSYAYTGSAATLTPQINYSLTCDTGSYAYTGSDTTLNHAPGNQNYSLELAVGSYVYTGSDASFSIASQLALDTGSYAYTGDDATLTIGRSLAADTGIYAYTGSDATFSINYRLPLDTGQYGYTGDTANLVYTPVSGFTLNLDTGSYVYTGSDATLTPQHNYTLTLDTGLYGYTGDTATFVLGRSFTVDTGTYDYTGSTALLTASSGAALSAETGVYGYTGSDATLTPQHNYTLTCDTGTYAYTGSVQTASFLNIVVGDVGNYQYTGSAAELTETVIADEGVYEYTGSEAGLTHSTSGAYQLALDSGVYGYDGEGATLTYTPAGVYTLELDAGVYGYDGSTVALQATIKTVAGTGSGGGRFFTPSRKIRKRRSRKNVKKKIKQVVRQRLEFRPVKVDDDKLNLITRRIENILDDLYRLDEIYQMARIANEVEKGKSVPGEQIEELKEAVGVFIPVVDEVIQEETKIPYDKKHDNIIAMLLAA